MEKEIIIVDDGSTDGTVEVLKTLFPNGTPGVRLVLKGQNEGKGAAIRAAAGHVKGDLVLIQDADLEYDPSNYPQLIKPFTDPEVQVVYGSRFLHTTSCQFVRDWLSGGGKNTHAEKRYLTTYLGIRLLNFLTYLLYGLKTTDEATCYKVFRSELFKSLNIQSTGFEFCPEVTAKLGRRRIRIVEVPISYHPRTYEQGKKLKVLKDGMRAIWTLIKYRFLGDR